MHWGGQSLKNKGFTLIELLAVLVILAIIALIATPIILNIINDSKESANKRSIDMYGRAIKLALENYELGESYEGIISIEELEPYIEYNGNEVECDVHISKINGIYLENCIVEGSAVDYTYGNEPIIKRATKKTKTLAGNIPQGNINAGDEYIINVDGTHKYHFYVLSTEEDKVNLIMSNNICSDGKLATYERRCLISWASKENYNDDTNYESNGNNKGPITAMNYLYETTKNWSNIENIKMNYVDEGSNYGGITTSGTTTKITTKAGTVISIYNNLKARLVTKEEMEVVGCVEGKGSTCPIWAVNGLHADHPNGLKEDIDLIYGYWILSSKFSSSYSLFVTYGASLYWDTVGDSGYSGIRPVISVLKTDLF